MRQWERITPAIAAEWLTRATKQRVSASLVEVYARKMREGRWVGECDRRFDPIRLDWQGRVTDGHHRLHAIVRSGVTVECIVLRRLRP